MAGDLGSNTAAQLISLQYFVTRINLCENLTISGSGYSGMLNCITVFGSSDASNAYDTFKVADAESDTSASWIDLMDATSIAKVSASAAAITPGTYNYGIIETRKPIKMNAAVTVGNVSSTLKTCAGGTVTATGTAESLLETRTVSDMTTCTQGTAVIGTHGGGRWFKFQNPIVLAASKSYDLDLAFNPAAAVSGGVASIGGWGTEATYQETNGTYVMIPPQLALGPVLRESTQKTIREQYTISGISGVSGQVVVDLYYPGTVADVGTATVAAAVTTFVHDSSATTFTKIASPYSVTRETDGTFSLKDHAGGVIVSGLTRSTTATTGAVQTVSVGQSIFISGGLSAGSSTVSATATFTGLTKL